MSKEHASDCPVNNLPAYPAGPCDCMPTQEMCRAAVIFFNGEDVYDKVPLGVLEIEESLYGEAWKVMRDAAPKQSADDARDAARWRWFMAGLGDQGPKLATSVDMAIQEDKKAAPSEKAWTTRFAPRDSCRGCHPGHCGYPECAKPSACAAG